MGTFVQDNGNDLTAAGTTITTSLTGVAAGNLIWVAAGCESSSTSITITDTSGNSYTQAAALSSAGDAWQLRLFVALNVAAGSPTITATFGASVGFRSLYAQERSGHLTSGAVDTGAGAPTTLRETSGTTRNAGTLTNSAAGDLVAIGQDFTTLGTPTVGAGFTARPSRWPYGGAASMLPEDQAFASSGSRSATFGMNNGATSYCLQMFLLNAGGAPAGRPNQSLAALAAVNRAANF